MMQDARPRLVDLSLTLRNTTGGDARGRVRLTVATSRGSRRLPALAIGAATSPADAPAVAECPVIATGESGEVRVGLWAHQPKAIAFERLEVESSPADAFVLVRPPTVALEPDPLDEAAIDGETPRELWGEEEDEEL